MVKTLAKMQSRGLELRVESLELSQTPVQAVICAGVWLRVGFESRATDRGSGQTPVQEAEGEEEEASIHGKLEADVAPEREVGLVVREPKLVQNLRAIHLVLSTRGHCSTALRTCPPSGAILHRSRALSTTTIRLIRRTDFPRPLQGR